MPLPEGRGDAARDEDVLGHQRASVSGTIDAVTGAHPTALGPSPAHCGSPPAGRASVASCRRWPAPQPPPRFAERSTRFDLGVLAAITVLLRLPAFFAERHLTFDDGVFGASAVAMRSGGEPFREVFSSQGPLFLPLVWVADLVGLRRLDSPRLLSVAAGVVLVAACTWRAGWSPTGPERSSPPGSTSGCASVLWVTGPLAADGVALAFAAITMCLVLRWRDDITVPAGRVDRPGDRRGHLREVAGRDRDRPGGDGAARRSAAVADRGRCRRVDRASTSRCGSRGARPTCGTRRTPTTSTSPDPARPGPT